jgi:hypothetical protein
MQCDEMIIDGDDGKQEDKSTNLSIRQTIDQPIVIF